VAMQDETLKNDIIAALEWEADIDLGAAGVSVIEGLVTLFGRVSTAPQRDAVERAVLRVRGVATVTNEIEVAANTLAGTKAGNGGASSEGSDCRWADLDCARHRARLQPVRNRRTRAGVMPHDAGIAGHPGDSSDKEVLRRLSQTGDPREVALRDDLYSSLQKS